MTARLRHESEGSTLVFTAVVLLVLIGMTALGVDAVSLYTVRRGLVRDTDAAALTTAGRMMDTEPCDASDAQDYAEASVEDNQDNPASRNGTITVTANAQCESPRSGWASVEAEIDSQLFFAPVLGFGSTTPVVSESTAEFGPVAGAKNLRPVPLCVGSPTDPTPYYWWNEGVPPDPALVHGTSVDNDGDGSPEIVYKILIDKDEFVSVCNPDGLPTPGNFKWPDFDGSGGISPSVECGPPDPSGGAQELKKRFQNGYPCMVYTHSFDDGTSSDHNCIPDSGAYTNDDCPSRTGSVNSIFQCVEGGSSDCDWEDQRCSTPAERAVKTYTTPADDCASPWVVLLYDKLVDHPGWHNSMTPAFHPVGFVGVVLRATSEPSDPDHPYLAIEFVEDATGQGVIGGPGTSDDHLHVQKLHLCGADTEDNCVLN